jgi:predicted Zn-dependent peptidase
MKKEWIIIWLAAAALSCFGRTEEKVFKNGLRLVFTETDHPSAVASAVIVVQAGEADGPPLLARRTNRMLLTGTEIRNRQQINREVESVSGRISAATSLTLSALAVQAPVGSFAACFKILCECAAKATFDSSEAARMAVFPEDDSPADNIFFRRKGFWNDAPFRLKLFSGSSLGADLRENPPVPFSREEMESFYGRWYRPGNTIVSVAGRVNRADVVKTVESFWNTGRQRSNEPVRRFSKGERDSTETVTAGDGGGFDRIWIGYEAPAFMSPGYGEMCILEMALASGRTGYFQNRVFTGASNGITVQSYYQSEPGIGYFVLYAQAPPGKGQAVKKTILAEMDKIRTGGLPETCYQLGVRKTLSKIAINSQYTLLNASFAAMSAAGGNAAASQIDVKNAIGRITPDEVRRAAQTVFVHPSILIRTSVRR